MEITIHNEQELDTKFQTSINGTLDATHNTKDDERKVGGGSDTGHRRPSN